MAQKKRDVTRKPKYWDRRRVVLAVVAGVMALTMLIPMFTMIFTYAGAVTQSEINELKNQAAELAAEKKELEDQLAAISADKSEAMAQKQNLEQQINVVRSEISNAQAMIDEYTSQIAEKEVELAEAKQEEEEYYELFCSRVRSMEEGGTVSYWSILFSSTSFSDLLDSVNFINEVMEYDNAVIDQLEAARKAVEEAKTSIEEAKEGQEAELAVLQDRQAELKEKEAEADALLAEIEAQEAEAQEALDAADAAVSSMDAEIAAAQRALEAQMAADNQTIVSESGFMWPLNGYYTLSSLAGSRIHPITGKPNNHGGIDIPAPKNTPILAAKSGVVITSGYNSSYGNYVDISHGGGSSTLYAHMNKRGVSVGESVSQGQVIGYVGTTGSSTGYHLHFEIRTSAGRQDPVDYYPDLTLYVRSGGKTVLLQH